MSRPALKLTTYFGERARIGERFLADAVFDLYARHELHTSVLFRGAYGFGAHHDVHGDRLLTLSESLPAVSAAVDTPPRIMAALADLVGIAGHGLLTLERAQLLEPGDDAVGDIGPEAKLTVYGGRSIRTDGQAGYVAAVDLLRAAGADAAVVLLGVDGTLHGERRRARFFARNAGVPLMLIAIGPTGALADSVPGLRELIAEPVVTIERIETLERTAEGRRRPTVVAERDPSGLAIWQKIMIHVEEPAHVDGRPVYLELVHRLHAAGAAGVTVLRAVRGYYGTHTPFADRFLALRRRVPVLVIAVDTPPNVQRWWPVVAALTARDGLVTSELVPAIHAPADGDAGGVSLAQTPASTAE